MKTSRVVAPLLLAFGLIVAGCVSGSATPHRLGSPLQPTKTPASSAASPIVAASPSSQKTSPAAGTFVATGSMSVEREGETATLLPNGLVLVAGGRDTHSVPLTSAELYDPGTGTFSPTGSMSNRRTLHTASLLPDGTVLLVGGADLKGLVAQSELYDPATGKFSPSGELATARVYHSTVSLADGRVLVVGGRDVSNTQLASAEVYDPRTGKFTMFGPLKTAREYATVTLLPGGRVLVAGGNNNKLSPITLATAELLDPTTGLFAPTGSMATGRSNHTATALSNGRVLIAGGNTDQGARLATLADAELYDPASGTFTPTGSMSTKREYHAAVFLADGRVLIVGGFGLAVSATAEVYDPLVGSFSPTGSMSVGRDGRPAFAVLADGRVLVAGGKGGDDYSTTSCELYQP